MQSKVLIDTYNKRQGGYDVTTPLRRRISGSRKVRRTVILYIFVGHIETVVTGGSNLGLDPWGAHRTPKLGSIMRECVSELPSLARIAV